MAQNDTPEGGLLNPTPPATMGQGADALSEAPSAPPSPPSFFDTHLSQAQARFNAVQKEVKKIGGIRKGLDALGRLGDTVTSDDVLDEMSDLVAHGADPKMFAAMMAGNSDVGVGPMPPQGEALQGWLGDISEKLLRPYEEQLRPAAALAQHQLGVAALHKMVELHAKASAPAVGAQPNPLGPTEPPVANTPAPSLLQ